MPSPKLCRWATAALRANVYIVQQELRFAHGRMHQRVAKQASCHSLIFEREEKIIRRVAEKVDHSVVVKCLALVHFEHGFASRLHIGSLRTNNRQHLRGFRFVEFGFYLNASTCWSVREKKTTTS